MPRHSSRPRVSRSRWYSYSFLLLNVVVWALAFFMVKPAYEVTTPFRYLLYRFVIAAAVSWPLLGYYWRTIPRLFITLKTIFLVETLGTGLALALLYSGLKFTTALEGNLLTTPLPIFITLGGILLLRERQERHEWLGLGMSFFGTVLLLLSPLLQAPGSFFHVNSLVGNLLILSHNFANMLYFPLAKKYYAGLPKLFVSSISFYVGILTFLGLSLVELFQLQGGKLLLTEVVNVVQTDLASPSVWIASGYMGIFGSLIGLTAYIKGQEGIEASEASWFGYLAPLVYIPVGLFVFGETIHPYQIFSLAIILLGVIIAEKRFHSPRLSSSAKLQRRGNLS